MLPASVSARLLADADLIGSRMARRIAAQGTVPPLSLGALRELVGACRDALRVLVRRLHDGRGPRHGDLDRLALTGARQADNAVPLDVLLGAYRVAAKVVWEEVVGSVVRDQEIEPETLVAVASQIFEYLDEISGAVGAAYLERRERLVRHRDRERDRILQVLLAGDDSAEVRRAAAAVELELQPPFAVAAASPSVDADRLIEEVWRPAGVLTVEESRGEWLLLIAPAANQERVIAESARVDPQLCIGRGPVAESLGDVAAAAHRARRARNVGKRLNPERRIHDDAEVGPFAVLDSDHDTLYRFVEALLGQLAQRHGPRAAEQRATLEAVLSTGGLGEAATELGVHRHTIVYRLQRLQEAGVDVGDPERRHLVWLALRARRLLTSPE